MQRSVVSNYFEPSVSHHAQRRATSGLARRARLHAHAGHRRREGRGKAIPQQLFVKRDRGVAAALGQLRRACGRRDGVIYEYELGDTYTVNSNLPLPGRRGSTRIVSFIDANFGWFFDIGAFRHSEPIDDELVDVPPR